MTYTFKVYYSDLSFYNTFKKDFSTSIDLCRYLYKYHDDFNIDIAVYDDNNKLLNIITDPQGVFIYDTDMIPGYYPDFGHITTVYLAQYDIMIDIGLFQVVFTAEYSVINSDDSIESHEIRIERKTNVIGEYNNDFTMVSIKKAGDSESYEFTNFSGGMLISYLTHIITDLKKVKDSTEFYTYNNNFRELNYLYPYTMEVC